MPKQIYPQKETLPKAIIVDIDGTLAHRVNRGPFDWMKVGEDTVDTTIAKIVSNYKDTVIIFTGRDEVCKDITVEWLKQHNISYTKLVMRPLNNYEKDCIIKRRMFEEHIKNKYYVEFILDDRDQVVKMWRDMGLRCLQVAEGNFWKIFNKLFGDLKTLAIFAAS